MIGDGEIHVAVVMPVLNILQEPMNDGRWNHVADVLCDIAAVSLKGDADHLAFLKDRATTVARVYGRIDLHRQMRIYSQCEYVWKSIRETTPRVTESRSPPIG